MFFSENELSLELIGVFKLDRQSYTKMTSHARSYDSISIRHSGTGNFKTKDISFSVKKGDVLYLPQNLRYSQTSRGETIFALHFINYSFSQKNTFEIISPDDSEFVENTIREMYDIWKEKKQGYRYKCTSLFYSLIYYLNKQSTQSSLSEESQGGKIKNALDYIHVHFRSEEISIPYLAEISSVSEPYLRKQFQKIYSLSPNRYITRLRLESASQLLQSGLYTVAEAAEKSGFNDTKYFSRVFKKHFGQSPKEFSKNTLIK